MNAKTCQNGTTECLRPIGSGEGNDAGYARVIKMCNPHATEAGMENEHNDYDHEGINAKIAAKKRLTKAQAAEVSNTTNCWICNPDLNLAKLPYTPREGTSRAGMVINVPIRATGIEKAAAVEAKLQAIETTGHQWEFKTAVAKKTRDVALTVTSNQESYILFWDAQGRFLGGSVQENGKTRKVRNVSEVLRLAR